MGRTGSILIAGLVAVIFTAGFFYEGKEEPGRISPASSRTHSPSDRKNPVSWVLGQNNDAADNRFEMAYASPVVNKEALSRVRPQAIVPAFLNLTSAPGYKREANLSLKVEDCAKAEEELETKLEEFKG